MNLNTKRNLKLILASGSLAMIATVGAACAGGGVAQSDFDALQTRVDRLQQSVDTAVAGVASLEALAESFGGLIPGGGTATGDALKLGYLADYSGGLATLGPAIEQGVQLAVEQINAAGGVNGQDVTFVTADSALDATTASTNATRLIDVERVHAIIGPLASGVTSAVSEGVIASARIPQISPSASSPAITNLNDNGFTFRTALSDAAQGVVLADNVVEADGAQNVGVLFVNNAYGLGLESVFEENFDRFNLYTSQSYEEDATTYSAELSSISSAVGGEALIIIGYNETTEIFRQAEQGNLFETYYFVDGNRAAPFDEAVYPNLEGFKGTAPGPAASTPARDSWKAAFEARFDTNPDTIPFVREAYDAAIAIALAATRAGSLDGAAIRDQLVGVGNEGGREVLPTVESIRAGLQAAANGEDVNYEGVASSVAWDEAGDITSGFVDIWEFRNGETPQIESVPFSLN